MGKSRERSPGPRQKGRGTRRTGANGVLPMTEELLREAPRHREEALKPLNAKQDRYMKAIQSQTLTFGVGPAGAGKTYVAASVGAEKLIAGEVERIILTRPIMEAGEELGFLPGDLKEKTDPYMVPLVEVLQRKMGRGHVEALIKAGKIEVVPLAFMRGRNLANCYCILDEAQNTTPTQMKMFLTRMAEGTIVVVDGDLSQVDLPPGRISGLADALDRLTGKPGVAVVRFTREDIVRSGFVQMVVDAYSNPVTGAGFESDTAGLQRVLGFD